ncbi:MAG: VCBS repeat-containing protein [Armatimonadetes bacterium]|nr:VCBS repeat-containing protein [Armatimonadota bacterium]
MRALARGVAIAAFLALNAIPAVSSQLIRPVALGGADSSAASAAVEPTVTSETQSVRYYTARMPTGIGGMKTLRDGSEVCVSQKVVTAVFSTSFYVQEIDRSAAIKVVCAPNQSPPASENCTVSFTGVLETVEYERQITVTSPIQIDSPSVPIPAPIMMRQNFLGGRPLNSYTPGLENSIHMHNVGQKVRTAGFVTAAEQFDSRGYFFYIDDGARIKDASFNYTANPNDPNRWYRGVRVYSSRIPRVGEFRSVVGISTLLQFDPTPSMPDSGDEFPIRAILNAHAEDVTTVDFSTSSPPQGPSNNRGTISGRVRLMDNPTTPVPVRIYSAYDSLSIAEVGGTYVPFTLGQILITGSIVTASSPGYLSRTKIVTAGSTDVTFDLVPAGKNIDITADSGSIRACSDETVRLSVLFRDREGKWLANRTLRVTTNRGSFVETGQPVAEITTDEVGMAYVSFAAVPDGPGTARISAVDYPAESASAEATIAITGPAIKLRAWPESVSAPGSTATISVTLTDRGQPLPTTTLILTTDWGLFVESSSQTATIVTGQDGSTSANLRLDEPGTATVFARHTNTCGNEVVGWTFVNYTSQPWISRGSRLSSPLVADLDGSGDGKKEIALITSDGTVNVWSSDGSLLWSKPAFSYGNNSVACANIDHDTSGSLELVVPSENDTTVYAYSGATGSTVAGWPARSDYPFIGVAVALADVNGDGAIEVVGGDESCFVFAWNGTGNWEKSASPSASFLWRNLTGSSGTAISGSSVAVGDITGEAGIAEVIVGTNDAVEVFAFPGDAWGDHLNPPLYVPGWPKDTGMWVESSAAIGDIDGDGKNDVAIGCDDGKMYIYYGATGNWTGHGVGTAIRSSPALADLDGDGKLDVIFGADDGRVYAIRHDGSPVGGWEGGIQVNSVSNAPVLGSPVVGDVNGDGKLEVVIGSMDGYLYCVYNDGTAHKSPDGHITGPIVWARKCAPSAGDSSIGSSPVLDDIDGDGKLDIIVASTGGVYLFKLDAPYTPESLPWPTFRGNNARTGCIAVPAAPVYGSIVGRVTRAGTPVENATIYITKADGSAVPVPHSDPPVGRPPVLTVGDPFTSGEPNEGGYSINQLEPNTTYQLRIVCQGYSDKVVPNINVEFGVTRVDVDM